MKPRARSAAQARAISGSIRTVSTVVLFILAAGVAQANPTLIAPDSARRGDAFSILVHASEPATAAEVQLRNPGGKVVLDVPGFRIRVTRDVEIWAACLAVDSTAPMGNYSVRVILTPANKAGSDSTLATEIRVVDRPFVHEQIPLNAALTDLRATPDPRKTAEAEQILALLARHDLGGQFWFGRLSMPVLEAVVTSHFGDRRRYLYSSGEVSAAIHYGIDLALPTGSPVRSDANGLVVFAGPLIVSGNTVVVEHLPGVYSLYYHLSEIVVRKGDRLETGQLVGAVGMTGLATGPHLHWEVRVDGVPVEPNSLLAQPLVDKERIFAKIFSEHVPLRPETGTVDETRKTAEDASAVIL
ncbi:MAG TPA: M23 family metallopeptidase, partial [Spirochaetia bacterium]|nr:M23 family metallopeptidase [Spirochaetia bacterium]